MAQPPAGWRFRETASARQCTDEAATLDALRREPVSRFGQRDRSRQTDERLPYGCDADRKDRDDDDANSNPVSGHGSFQRRQQRARSNLSSAPRAAGMVTWTAQALGCARLSVRIKIFHNISYATFVCAIRRWITFTVQCPLNWRRWLPLLTLPAQGAVVAVSPMNDGGTVGRAGRLRCEAGQTGQGHLPRKAISDDILIAASGTRRHLLSGRRPGVSRHGPLRVPSSGSLFRIRSAHALPQFVARRC